MTVKEFLASIDPVEAHWKTTSPGHWTNTDTGAKYDSTDIVQAQLDAYNATAGKPGRPRFIPGITPVPKEIEVVPGGRPPVDTGGNKPGPNKPGPITGGPLPPGLGGVTNPYIPGSTWNPTGPGTPGTGPGGSPVSGGPMQWQENAGTGTGGPQHTGMAMPFTPWGEQQAMSTEILRYGGRPNSGAGGKWTGGGPPSQMINLFTPRSNSGQTSAGALDPPYAQGGSDPAGQTLPGGGSYDTSGTTKEQMAARAKALMQAEQARILREFLAGLEGGSTSNPIHTGTGTGGLGR
jgi:hypothetical protein